MRDFIPYACHSIDADDLRALQSVLESDWLTTGPQIDEFERTISDFVGVPHAVAVCNGTAALHTALAFDHRERAQRSTWVHEMIELGYNYHLTDFQSALGISQLKKLPERIQRRQEIAIRYDQALSSLSGIDSLQKSGEILHAYHLYVVKVDPEETGLTRKDLFHWMREKKIGVNVHYLPVYLHPYYRKNFGRVEGLCPHAESVYERILSLPMYPQLINSQIDYVIETIQEAAMKNRNL